MIRRYRSCVWTSNPCNSSEVRWQATLGGGTRDPGADASANIARVVLAGRTSIEVFLSQFLRATITQCDRCKRSTLTPRLHSTKLDALDPFQEIGTPPHGMVAIRPPIPPRTKPRMSSNLLTVNDFCRVTFGFSTPKLLDGEQDSHRFRRRCRESCALSSA